MPVHEEKLVGERELLRRIAEGDQRAFTALFEAYQSYVYEYGKKLTRSGDLAAEIVQEVFLKIWIYRNKLGDIQNFGAYMNTVVRNHSLNVIKKLAREALSNHEVLVQTPETDDSTAQLLDFNDSRRLLQEVVESLPEQQRRAYQLCHTEGLKYEEAAAQMNISPRTVQNHMVQALKTIRHHFRNNALAYPVLFGILFK